MSSSAKADDPVFQSCSFVSRTPAITGSPAFAGDDGRTGTSVAPNDAHRNPMTDNDDIPFNRSFPLRPGVVDEVRPGVRRILCDNPSPFTFTGTVSYIVGRGKVAIIDPGPDNQAHAAALLDAVRGETVTHILVTHTHRDHSPNTARIKAATGAIVYAEGPHRIAPRGRALKAKSTIRNPAPTATSGPTSRSAAVTSLKDRAGRCRRWR